MKSNVMCAVRSTRDDLRMCTRPMYATVLLQRGQVRTCFLMVNDL